MTELVAALSDSNGDGAWLQETFPARLKEIVTCFHMVERKHEKLHLTEALG